MAFLKKMYGFYKWLTIKELYLGTQDFGDFFSDGILSIDITFIYIAIIFYTNNSIFKNLQLRGLNIL
jgi:hypothetical protein